MILAIRYPDSKCESDKHWNYFTRNKVDIPTKTYMLGKSLYIEDDSGAYFRLDNEEPVEVFVEDRFRKIIRTFDELANLHKELKFIIHNEQIQNALDNLDN